VCNVIGVEQNYLQEIVRYTLKLLSLDNEYKNSFHMSYKHVNAPHARFSGRSGNWYEERAWADAVFDDTLAAAFTTISKKRPDLEDNPQKREEIISNITVGAIRYWLIKFSTETEIKFRIEDATSLEGDTGPFLMYSFVRAKKILGKLTTKRKGKKASLKKIEMQFSPQEKQLILELHRFPEVVQKAALSFQPLMVSKYAFDLASSFNRFYETSRVINAETNELKSLRAALVESFAIVMGNTLRVLGIPFVDEM
jgi:arginyl-tRNA synthetase